MAEVKDPSDGVQIDLISGERMDGLTSMEKIRMILMEMMETWSIRVMSVVLLSTVREAFIFIKAKCIKRIRFPLLIFYLSFCNKFL